MRILLEEADATVLWSFIILVVIPVAVLLFIVLPIVVIRKAYEKFVIKHSVALKQLVDINDRYSFKDVDLKILEHDYDNENFYDTISTEDYLTYQLQFFQKEAMKNIKNAAYNDKLFDSYDKEVDALKFGQYDTNDLPDNKKPYVRAELRVFKKTVQEPIVKYSVVVNLRCVRMNGNVVDRKSDVFYSDEISKIIDRLNWKKGNRFLDNEIWASLCRVERGKVTNKMRFYIYNRDGYRCCKCHRKTNDLEIDHIWPIAKGGKTTLDNLQTLCHRCNARKGDSVDYEN